MSAKQIFASVVAGIVVILAIAIGTGSFYQINEPNVGVVLTNGKYNKTVGPGLDWKKPFLDDVLERSTARMTYKFDNLPSYSSDKQVAQIAASVTLHVEASQWESAYRQYQTLDNIVNRVIATSIPDIVKNQFGKITSTEVITKREEFRGKVLEELRELTKTVPVTIDDFRIQEVSFSDAFDKAVEMAMQAQVKVNTEKANLDTIRVIAEQKQAQADGEAKSKIMQSQAAATAIEQQGLAEAKAIRVRGEAEAAAKEAMAKVLRDNPRLVDFEIASKYKGDVPQIVTGSGGGMILNLPGLNK